MSDFGTLIESCVAETKMPGEEPALRRHAVAALKNYRPSRFIFSEKSVQFALVPQKDEYKPGGETILTSGITYLTFPGGTNAPFVNFGPVLDILPSSLNGLGSFSIAVKFRTNTLPTVTNRHLVHKVEQLNAGASYALQTGVLGDVIFAVKTGLLIFVIQHTPPVTYADGQFHELVGILDVESFGSTGPDALWLNYDGTLVGPVSGIATGTSIKNPWNLYWGANSTDTFDPLDAEPLDSDIERVVFWSKAVTQLDIDIAMNWKPGDDIPHGVVGLWPLVEMSGSLIKDHVPKPLSGGPGTIDRYGRPNDGLANPLVQWGSEGETFQIDFPGDIMEFDEVRRKIGTRSSVPLHPVTIGELRELQASGLAFGQPDYYCWHHNRFIVWPRPSAAHVLTLDYHVDATRDEATGEEITPSSNGSVTNEYFRRAEELLRSRTLATFGLGRDDDYELAKRMKILNLEAEKSLYRERDLKKVDGFQAGFHL